MSRFGNKGGTTKGGRKRVHKDRKGNPLPSKAIAMSSDAAFKAKCAKAGVVPTRRQQSKHAAGFGALCAAGE